MTRQQEHNFTVRVQGIKSNYNIEIDIDNMTPMINGYKIPEDEYDLENNIWKKYPGRERETSFLRGSLGMLKLNRTEIRESIEREFDRTEISEKAVQRVLYIVQKELDHVYESQKDRAVEFKVEESFK